MVGENFRRRMHYLGLVRTRRFVSRATRHRHTQDYRRYEATQRFLHASTRIRLGYATPPIGPGSDAGLQNQGNFAYPIEFADRITRTRFRVLRSPESRRDHTRHESPEAGLMTIEPEDVLRATDELLFGENAE